MRLKAGFLVHATNKTRRYVHRKKEVRCTKEKAIIVGSVIGSIFGTSRLRSFTRFHPVDTVLVLLAALYLYATCSDRLKKRRRSRSAEETEPLSRGTGSTLDVEKGVSKAGDDSMVRLFNTEEYKVSLTTYHADSVTTASRQVRWIVGV